MIFFKIKKSLIFTLGSKAQLKGVTVHKTPPWFDACIFQVNTANSSRLWELKAKLDNIKNTSSCHQH
jgi:hypothetical protein